MARFFDSVISRRASSDTNTWTVVGGTIDGSGTVVPANQPTFNGDPLFAGHYSLIGDVCSFAVDVDFDNITNFGTGQYFIQLPYRSHHNLLLASGCIHDFSSGKQYSILGHATEGSDILELMSISSAGLHEDFTNSVPFNLAVADSFHISGSYEVMVD